MTRISESEGRTITLEVLRENEAILFEVTPEIDSETGRAMIGIVPGSEISVTGALVNSYHQTRFIFTEIF